MHASQANRARIAQRAPKRTNDGAVGINPAARSDMPSHPMAAGVVRRSRAMPMTGAQRDSQGNQSDWSRSPEFFTDPKWGWTVGEQ